MLSIQRSTLHILIDNNEHFTNKLDKILLLVFNKKIIFTIQNLIVSIVNSLKSLGVNSLTELFQGYNNSHVISLSSLQEKYRNSWKENQEQAFRCLVALLSSPPTQDITPDIARNVFKSSRIPTLPTLVTNHTPTQISREPSSIPFDPAQDLMLFAYYQLERKMTIKETYRMYTLHAGMYTSLK